MYCITMNYFINSKYERPEVFATETQFRRILELRNDPENRETLITVVGSDFWFSPKDILFVNELDMSSNWWKNQAPQYFIENYEAECESR